MNLTGEDLVYQSRHVRAYFQMDYPGIVRYAMQSRELGNALEQTARATVAYARSISPVGSSDNNEPHYRDMWEHQPYIERNTGDPPFPRQAQLVINQSRHAAAVEFGTGRGTSAESLYGHRIFPRIIDFLQARP